jgi:hypothetical protein
MERNFRGHMKNPFSKSSIPLEGWPPSEATDSNITLNKLSNAELIRVNEMLPWQVFTTDSGGRRLGNYAWKGKRQDPQSLSDPRIGELLCGLEGKRVLEVGCLEGVHTIGLCLKGVDVTAVDGRIENVIKTQVRASLYGCLPKVALADLDEQLPKCLGNFSACFHVGVLYHLSKPVEHLIYLLPRVSESILLDTHIADDSSEVYPYPGFEEYKFSEYQEFGRKDIFSGLKERSRWLTLNSIRSLLAASNFEIQTEAVRQERHGPRVKIKASRVKS